MKGILCLIIFARIGFASAQSLEAQVIGSTGNTFSGSTFSVSATIGESTIFLVSGSGVSASQGFQQSRSGGSSARVDVNAPDSETNVWIYPNPVSKELYIVSHKSVPIKQITLFNVVGDILLNKTSTGLLQERFVMQEYASGMYVLRIEMEDGKSITKKVIKE